MININDALNLINPLKIIKSYLASSTFNWGMAAMAVGSMIAGNQQAQAAKSVANQQAEAAKAAQEGAKFDPYGIQGLFGGAQFGNGTATGTLSPEMQRYADIMQGQAGGFLTQGQTPMGALASEGGMGFLKAGMGADPYAGAQSQFEKMEAILNPGRERTREALEGKLLRQGRLGSTGGGIQQQGLESSIEESRQRGLFDALQQAQGIQQQQIGLGTQLGLFGQGQEDIGFQRYQQRMAGLQGLDAQTMQYLNLGGAFGGRAATAGAVGGQFGMQGAQGSALTNLGGTLGLTSQLPKVGSAIGGLFDKYGSSGGSAGSMTPVNVPYGEQGADYYE